ncbi:hypothetical protein GE061_007990 [Apolygus lucorum]|uniref:AP-3 complex subunit delta domain-containing protein n=1 Tax=Apolygus lucorum TaxID=248454 RepID=A0A6A4J286_APOLU|nr:hypothetical protein GE061_007990 [Apolygus lucorum]
MREARRQEQAMNPNYLKSSSKEDKNVPVAQIDLTVPLIIPGLASSDKYLPKDRSIHDKKKKKKRKDKKGKGTDEEEEGEVPSVGAESVQVYTGREEMPDGVEDSGDDGKSDGDVDVDDLDFFSLSF